MNTMSLEVTIIQRSTFSGPLVPSQIYSLTSHSIISSTESNTVIGFIRPVFTMDIVLRKRKNNTQRREKMSIICQILGTDCPFLKEKDSGTFRNVAELKYLLFKTNDFKHLVLGLVSEVMKELIAIDKCREDALRHLDPYQCKICGKRFGKRFAKKRHKSNRNPCVPAEENGNSKPGLWVSPELRRAVSELERAKGYDMVIAAIDRCKKVYSEF